MIQCPGSGAHDGDCMHEQRAELPNHTHSEREAALFGARVDLCFRNIHQGHFGTLILWLAVWWQYAQAAREPWFGLWLALFPAYVLLSFFLVHHYVRRRPPPAEAPRWAWWLTLHNAVLGSLWGVVPLLVEVWDQPFLMNLLILLIVAPWFGGAVVTAALPRVFYAWSLPQLLVFEAVMIGHDGTAFIGGLALAAYGACAFVAFNARRQIEASLRLRYENLDLAEAAARANRDKTRFLAAASHDLRQPLHALELFHEALAPRLERAEQRELLDQARRATRELAGQMDALLDVSRLELGKVAVQRSGFAVDELFARIAAEFALQAQAKGLELRWRPCGRRVDSDPLLLTRMLRNLVANAIRHTGRGGVLIGARRRGGRLRIGVWDTGPGIPEAERGRVFEDFVQLGNPARQRDKGQGLGLAIVRQLAALLDHPLALASRVGHGSAFTIEVPLLAAPDRPAPQAGEAPGAARTGLEDARVLVIEDDATVREALRALLTGWGCRVVTATDADEALAACRHAGPRSPDLILSDYRLSGKDDGLAAIEAVCRHYGRAIPALLMSGDTAPGVARAAEAAGHSLLVKPVRTGRLRGAMTAALGSA